jgi:hypothetical protein
MAVATLTTPGQIPEDGKLVSTMDSDAGGILFCPRVALGTSRKNQLEPDVSKWPCQTSAPRDRHALMIY